MKGFLDIETGGFSITKNGVCEIALIAVNENNEVVDTFCTLIQPYKREDSDKLVSYKDDAMAINGISIEDMILKGMDVTECINSFLDFCAKHNIQTIVEHSLNDFDTKRIEHLMDRFADMSKLPFAVRKVNTINIAKGKLNLPSYSLENLCAHFGIENTKAHSAEGDALATLELYKRLI